MTEYCFQSTKNKNKFSDLTKFCSFILSHPLYFSYIIFFSPYLFKLLSFLSPLFFTTSLIFLSLLTTLIPLHSILNSNEGFFLTAYNTFLENFHPKLDDEEDEISPPIEEFEVYKAVFDIIPTIEVIEDNPIENDKIQENPFDSFVEKVSQVGKGAVDQCESLTVEQEKVCTKPKKKESIITRTESEAIEVYKTPKSDLFELDNGEKFTKPFSHTVSFGSMRKEKEWRRTLACKLFEERHNGSNNKMNENGGVNEEGMDLLWETHESDSNRVKPKEDEIKRKKKKEKIEDLMMVNEDEDEDDDRGKFCCLQALKLSAGKMNLSMGMKFSKAFKGIGLIQNHVRKQGKKGYK